MLLHTLGCPTRYSASVKFSSVPVTPPPPLLVGENIVLPIYSSSLACRPLSFNVRTLFCPSYCFPSCASNFGNTHRTTRVKGCIGALCTIHFFISLVSVLAETKKTIFMSNILLALLLVQDKNIIRLVKKYIVLNSNNNLCRPICMLFDLFIT